MEEYKNKYLWITPPYFIFIGVLYLWAYWSSFEINIFEYAGLTDLIKVAIIPVGSLFFFILLGFILGEYPKVSKRSDDEAKNSLFGKFLYKTKFIWEILYWLVLLYLILGDSEGKWRVLPFVGMLYPFFLVMKSSFLNEIESDSTRTTIILAICILPIYSFSQGKLNANEILQNEAYKYVESIGEITHAKYIGHVSQHLFFISKDNKKIVIKKMDQSAIVLNNNDNKKPNKAIKWN